MTAESSSASTPVLSEARLSASFRSAAAKCSLKVTACAAAAALIAFRVVGLVELPLESEPIGLALLLPLLTIPQLLLVELFSEQCVVVVNDVFDKHKQLESFVDASQLLPLHSPH